ncbi:MAG: prepilin-type N-terminal cleavage/methylation domain-containing protein [Thermoguttaceae bacterium]
MKTSRRGMSLLELITAAALLAVLLTAGLQMSGAAAAQRRAIRQRQAASLELANILERLASRPWSELTPQQAGQERLSPAVAALLPRAELHVEVAPAPGQPEARRITASLRWQGPNGMPLPPVSLSAWRYRLADAAGQPRNENTPPKKPTSP